MPKITFYPPGIAVTAEPNTKVLAAANRNKISLRFGCSACRCGTCGIAVSGDGTLTDMKDDERKLLRRMELPLDGTVRLACQARILAGDVNVDLTFQDSYSPDQGDDEI